MWLIATVVWIAVVGPQQFELARTGAVSLAYVVAATIGVPVAALAVGYLAIRMARAFGSSRGSGSN